MVDVSQLHCVTGHEKVTFFSKDLMFMLDASDLCVFFFQAYLDLDETHKFVYQVKAFHHKVLTQKSKQGLVCNQLMLLIPMHTK